MVCLARKGAGKIWDGGEYRARNWIGIGCVRGGEERG